MPRETGSPKARSGGSRTTRSPTSFNILINAQTGNGGAQDVWLNEGLSHLAEEVAGHAVNGFEPGTSINSEQLLATQARIDVFNRYYLNNWYNLSQYLSAPGDTAALLNSADPLDYNTFRMRGAAWSFLRYLLDRYEDGSEGEAARVRALIRTSSSDSRDAITQVFGEPFERLATQWSTMLVSSDRSDVDPAEELQLSSYQVREVFESKIGDAVNPPGGGYPSAATEDQPDHRAGDRRRAVQRDQQVHRASGASSGRGNANRAGEPGDRRKARLER